MNRRDRRAAKRFNKGHVTHTAIGRLQAVDPNYGLPVNCYTCGAPHQGLGVGRIMDRGELEYVPLCEPCMATPEETTNAIIRKFGTRPISSAAKAARSRTNSSMRWPSAGTRASIN